MYSSATTRIFSVKGEKRHRTTKRREEWKERKRKTHERKHQRRRSNHMQQHLRCGLSCIYVCMCTCTTTPLPIFCEVLYRRIRQNSDLMSKRSLVGTFVLETCFVPSHFSEPDGSVSSCHIHSCTIIMIMMNPHRTPRSTSFLSSLSIPILP